MARPTAKTRRSTALAALRDRRGAVAAAFVVGSTAVLGMVALATEGGVWYAARRNAQTAADMGAYAGAAQLAWRGQDTAGQNLAFTAARTTAANNGFASERQADGTQGRTRVDVQVGRWDAAAGRFIPTTTNPTAVQVEVRQIQRLGIAAIIANDPPIVNVRGVASFQDDFTRNICMLSLTGQLTITGASSLNAPNCALASNRQGVSIDCGAGQQNVINVLAMVAVGTASEPCDNRGATVVEGQLAAPDPYQYVRNAWPAAMPTIGNNDCQPTFNGQGRVRPRDINQPNAAGGTTWRPLPSNTTAIGQAVTGICDDIKISNAADELVLTPGTYFFADANLQVSGGRVRCEGCTGGQGVTLVFTALTTGGGNRVSNRIGTIQITGGEVDLTAPTVGPWYSYPVTRENPLNPGVMENTQIFDGMLVFRDPRAQPNNTKNVDNMSNPNTARITGNSDSIRMDGGFYLPTTQIFVAGNTAVATNQDDCQSIVGATIQVTGNSGLDVRGCATRGTTVSRVRVIRLVN